MVLRPCRRGEERRRWREKKALSQTIVAARMGTSASVVSKLEAGGSLPAVIAASWSFAYPTPGHLASAHDGW